MSRIESNYYDLIGVDEDASKAKITRAWKQTIQKYHPDSGGDEALYEATIDAGDVLRDDALREIYDVLDHDTFIEVCGPRGEKDHPSLSRLKKKYANTDQSTNTSKDNTVESSDFTVSSKTRTEDDSVLLDDILTTDSQLREMLSEEQLNRMRIPQRSGAKQRLFNSLNQSWGEKFDDFDIEEEITSEALEDTTETANKSSEKQDLDTEEADTKTTTENRTSQNTQTQTHSDRKTDESTFSRDTTTTDEDINRTNQRIRLFGGSLLGTAGVIGYTQIFGLNNLDNLLMSIGIFMLAFFIFEGLLYLLRSDTTDRRKDQHHMCGVSGWLWKKKGFFQLFGWLGAIIILGGVALTTLYDPFTATEISRGMIVGAQFYLAALILFAGISVAPVYATRGYTAGVARLARLSHLFALIASTIVVALTQPNIPMITSAFSPIASGPEILHSVSLNHAVSYLGILLLILAFLSVPTAILTAAFIARYLDNRNTPVSLWFWDALFVLPVAMGIAIATSHKIIEIDVDTLTTGTIDSVRNGIELISITPPAVLEWISIVYAGFVAVLILYTGAFTLRYLSSRGYRWVKVR